MNKSNLEMVIGPMFSQKCLNPDFMVYTYDGKLKILRDLTLDDQLISSEGNPVNILSFTRGFANMYFFKLDNLFFSTTGNHIFIMKTKLFYYSPFTEKRGILYYISKNTNKIVSIPILKNKLKNKLNNEDILKENSIIEITAESYCKNFHYRFLLTFIKHPIQFKEREYNFSKMELNDNIMYNNIENKYEFLKILITKFYKKRISEKIYLAIPLEYDKDKLNIIFDTLLLNYTWLPENILIFYNFKLKKESNILFSLNTPCLGGFVGFELDGDSTFLSADGYVMHNSTFLINIINKYNSINKKISVFSHSLDSKRYSEYFLTSHDKQQIKCQFISDLNTLLTNEDYINSELIVIEEAQFFDNIDEFIINQLDNTRKHFIICGLSGDSNRKPFKKLLNLIPHCDIIHKKEAFCSLCKDGTLAIYTKKKKTSPEEMILIGSDDYYESVCRYHYNHCN